MNPVNEQCNINEHRVAVFALVIKSIWNDAKKGPAIICDDHKRTATVTLKYKTIENFLESFFYLYMRSYSYGRS